MAKDDTKRIVPQRPTLLIGLGGTGKQVLLNLRRMFQDHHGVPSFGHIGHLWIDTDTRNLTLDGSEMGFLLKEVDFLASEKVSVELSTSDLKNYFAERRSYPNIYSWFDPALDRYGEIRDGAGQIRMFGRLAFFHHYPKIRTAVQNALQEIRSSANLAKVSERHGIRVDGSRTDAWLIFSIAGGTGSGMFLDMAFALKHLDPNISIRGIIVLPSVFSSEFNNKVFGNAYAALMELEHYNYAKEGGDAAAAHYFPVAWTLDQHQRGELIRGPVFELSYLIDNRPDGQGGELNAKDKNALCEMLAEALFVEYGNKTEALAADWGSKRSNLQDSLTGVVRMSYTAEQGSFHFTEEFCCRYGSLGLSKLHVPIQRIGAVVRHRMAEELIGYWTAPAEVPNNFDDLIAREIHPRLNMKASGGKASLFVRDLTRGAGGDSLEAVLHTAVQRRRSDMSRAAINPDIATRITDWFQTDMLVGQLDTANPDRSRRGALSRQIHEQSVDNLYTQIAGELDRIIAENLTAPGQRFTLVREMLRRLTATLEQNRAGLTQRSDAARGQAARTRREIADRLGWLDQVRGTFTRRTIVDVVMDLCGEALTQELRAQVYEAAARLCQRLLDLIGTGTVTKDAAGRDIVVESGLLKQVGELETLLVRDAQPLLRDRMAALRQIPSSPIQISLFEEHDLKDFYVTREGRPVDAAAMADLSRRFFEEERDTAGGLWQMRELLRRDGVRRLVELLLDFTRRSTPHLEERTIDTLDRFTRKYPPERSDYEGKVQQLVDNGMPWLARPTHHVISDTAFQYRKKAVTLAICPSSPRKAREDFQAAVKKTYGEADATVDSPPDRIYVSSEMAGIPLLVVPDLDRYRNEGYFSNLRAGYTLHTHVDFEKYQDILLRRAGDAETYIATLRILGSAIAAGVVRGDYAGSGSRTGRLIEFSYTDRVNHLFAKTETLGPLRLAIKRLSEPGEARLRQAIETETKRRLTELDDTGRAQWLVLLRHHGKYQPTGNTMLSNMLDKLAEEIERTNPELIPLARRERDSIAQWTETYPQGSGILCLPALDRLQV